MLLNEVLPLHQVELQIAHRELAREAYLRHLRGRRCDRGQQRTRGTRQDRNAPHPKHCIFVLSTHRPDTSASLTGLTHWPHSLASLIGPTHWPHSPACGDQEATGPWLPIACTPGSSANRHEPSFMSAILWVGSRPCRASLLARSILEPERFGLGFGDERVAQRAKARDLHLHHIARLQIG